MCPDVLNMHEFELINKFKGFQNLTPRVVRGIGDDAAVLALDRKRYQLFTTDMCVEGVHFATGTPAHKIGWKAMAVNVSDIAAMGGRPTCAVVSLGIPSRTRHAVGLTGHIEFPRRKPLTGNSMCPDVFTRGLYQGLHACARKFGVSIVGGDTVASDKLVINVALLGEVEKKYLVTRAGAKKGDHIFVTGPLGGSFKSGRHLSFMPRLKEAQKIVRHYKPTAMMDISDGLAGDLRHILKASGVGALLAEACIPLYKDVTLAQGLSDGEDFELLFTAPSSMARKCPFPVVGVITDRKGKLMIKDRNGKEKLLTLKGFEHC